MFRSITLCAVALLSMLAVNFSSAHEPKAKEKKIILTVKIEEVKEKDHTKPAFKGKKASVDVAILLDTSNSMDGLIKQAKSQLWTIVQQFAKAEKNGQTPILRVALFEYGNTRLPASEGYIRQVVPLTDDLDKLSEALFALKTSGGDEYCGQVIDEAITRLDWSKEPNGYKAIFIAGNEPFTQGQVDYRKSCKRAIENGIVVNTIHCGNNNSGISGKWKDGALLTEGEFFNIDQDRVVHYIKCPQDKLILELNLKLNRTYLWCGQKSVRKYRELNQTKQDGNAALASPSSSIQRAITKSGAAYGNRGRDIVDSIKEDGKFLEKLKKEELPDAMQKMTTEERKKHVQKMAGERAEVQKKIGKLATEREAYLKIERKKLATKDGKATLGDAVVATIQKQLKKSGFSTAK